MAFTPVTGRLTSVGPSEVNQKSSSTTFRSLLLKEANTGEEISVGKCVVDDNLTQYMRTGTEGVFLFGKTLFGNSTLVGFKNEEVQKVDPDLAKEGMGKTPLLCIMVFFLGFLLTITIIGLVIGIPMMIFATVWWFWMRSFLTGSKQALHENGFSLSTPRAI